MLYNLKRPAPAARDYASPASEARKLRLEYNRLHRRLQTQSSDTEAGALRGHIERIARELGLIRADSVHAVESKLRVALDLIRDQVDESSHKLLSSVLSDLHYLAVLSDPIAPAASEVRQKALTDVGERERIKRVLGDEYAGG